MTQLLIKTIADFQTTLTTKTAVGATTATLTSGLDGDGVQLPTGTYGFTVDRNNANKEYFTATLTGSALTNIKTVTRGTGVGTSGLLLTHRKGAEVIISDHVAIKRMMDVLDGTTGFDSATPLKYDAAPTFTTDHQIVTKKYVADTLTGAVGTATEAVYGTTKLSVAPASAGVPISVGDNDGRVPTQGENDALAGTSGTPSASNKFVTNDDTTGTGAIPRASAVPAVTNVQTFTATDTWTKPTGALFVEVILVGQGGGGAGGGSGDSVSGGSGGGGGSVSIKKYLASALGATEAITIGNASNAGAANGNGSAGDPTSFGTTVFQKANGGSGGLTNGGTVGAGGTVGNGEITQVGGDGALGQTHTTPGSDGATEVTNFSPRGGAGGGGRSSNPNSAAGGTGGSFGTNYVKAGGTGGAGNVGGTGGAGNIGLSSRALRFGGTGGGGGGGGSTGGVGGAGIDGSGGGGGGGGLTGGIGGVGGAGFAIITTFF